MQQSRRVPIHVRIDRTEIEMRRGRVAQTQCSNSRLFRRGHRLQVVSERSIGELPRLSELLTPSEEHGEVI